jgi:hypothetical protein
MFLHRFFENCGCGGAACVAPLSLIQDLKLYLIGFLNRTFPGENAKNRAFFGGEKLKSTAVYRSGIKCVTKTRTINGRRFHLESCWLALVADGRLGRVTGQAEAP